MPDGSCEGLSEVLSALCLRPTRTKNNAGMLQHFMEAARRQSEILPAVMAFSHEGHKMSFLSSSMADLNFILSSVLELNDCRQPSASVIELTNTAQITKEDIMNIVFQRKGIWLMCQRAEVSSANTYVERLSSIRRELAQCVLGAISVPKEVESLINEQRNLEKTLAATNRIDSMLTQVSISEVRRCIPERACVLEFVHIHQAVPDMRTGLQYMQWRCLAAVVLPASFCEVDQPLLLDFGTLDEDIEQYMKFLTLNPRECEIFPKSVVRSKVAEFFPAGQRLRERLLDSIRCKIPSFDHLIVAADGPLARLPWEALPLQDDGYVLDWDLRISYVSCARDLLTWSFEVPASMTCGCAVIADPTFELEAQSYNSAAPQAGYPQKDSLPSRGRAIPVACEQVSDAALGWTDPGLHSSALRAAIAQEHDRGETWFGPLNHTRVEGEMVTKCLDQAARIFGFDLTQSFFGEEASSSVLFQLGPLRILHIATHGFYVNPHVEQADARPCRLMRSFKEVPYQDPWDWCGLAFAGAQTWLRKETTKHSGILTAAEFRGMNLQSCELVTLSACHTGLGEMFQGEGMLGLTRACQVAGAKRVLASQRAISDVATKDLMIAFYEELVQRNEVGEALRLAQRKLRDRPGRAGWPLFWAGLKLIGNPSGKVFGAST